MFSARSDMLDVYLIGGAVVVTLAVLVVWERLFGKDDPPG